MKLFKYVYLLLGILLFVPIIQMALYNKLPPLYLLVGGFGALSYGLISRFYLIKEAEELNDLIMNQISILSEEDVKAIIKGEENESN